MELTQQEIEFFITEVKKFSEYDFSGYSIKSFTRRVQKILTDNNMSLDALLSKMDKNHKFLEYVVKEITVNTTEPFRTPSIWNNLIPLLKEKYADSKSINIWHAGTSNGLEVYSMLILLYEMGLFHKAKVYGTDLNDDVLEIARNGKYKMHDFDEYWPNLNEVMGQFKGFSVEKYLEVNDRRGYIKAKSFLTDKPVFVKHNLIKDGNIFGLKFDIIMCCNVLIYFDHEYQDKVLKFFYENLSDTGILVIGRHESILSPLQRKFNRIESIYVRKTDEDIWNLY